ncbi:MAG: polysaccharide deacetylase family protein [Clostridia bacterium]|nr:polysaccharide deacetylase family protein [Clostridia bacterium]
MKKSIVATAICLVAVLIVCAVGGYTSVLADKRKVPIYKVATDSNRVSISFDAAWGADKTLQILDVCDQYNVKATFFLVGFWVDKFPEMVEEIARRGHEIGTHSQTHPQMSKLSAQQVSNELSTSCSKISAITGNTVTVFRAPFGDYNNQLLEVASGLGLYTIQWSIDSLDWKGISAQQIAERVTKATRGDIILCHNNSDHIVQALPAIFTALQGKGLTFVPIGQLIYKTDYTVDHTGVQHPNLPT